MASEELEKGGALLFTDRHLLLSAGKVEGKWQWYWDNAATQPEIEMIVVPRTGGDGYVLQAAIPFSVLGFEPKVGRKIRLDVGVDGSKDGKARQQQLMWNGKAMNSRNRSAWGEGKVVD